MKRLTNPMNQYKFDDLSIGMGEEFKVVIEPSKMVNFLEISNDINPLHLNSKYAKEKGFEDKVVYGLLTASFYSTLVGVYLPGKYCILQGVDVQFLLPVYKNDTLIISGEISYINQAYRQIEIKAKIINQDNKKVSKATIKTGVLE
jgi:3-hydroxybutyryl-CoA dehydratase